MAMTRQERIALHKKQERTQIKDGEPLSSDLDEGVPTLRKVDGVGVVEYVKHNGSVFKKILDKV